MALPEFVEEWKNVFGPGEEARATEIRGLLAEAIGALSNMSVEASTLARGAVSELPGAAIDNLSAALTELGKAQEHLEIATRYAAEYRNLISGE